MIKLNSDSTENKENLISFSVSGDVVGKPRMTRRDKWQKRPCVIRYRDFCDRARAQCPSHVSKCDIYRISVVAYIGMPPSWSQRKRDANCLQPHRAKPDADNIVKGVMDALFEDDSGIWDVRCRKFWCMEGDDRIEIRLWHLPGEQNTQGPKTVKR